MIIAPAIAAALIVGLAWRLHSPAARKGGGGPAWAAPLAVATAAALGHALLEGWPAYPDESWRWLAWIAVAGGLLGIAESFASATRARVWIARLPVLAACTACLLLRVAKRGDGSLDLAHVALDAGAVAAGWIVLATAIPAHGPRAGTIALCLVATAATPML